MPEPFTPPKGAFGWIAPCLLIHTVPHSKLGAEFFRLLDILRPHRTAEAVRIVVGAHDDFIDVGIADDRQSWTELFLSTSGLPLSRLADQVIG